MELEARGLIYDATDRPAAERIAFFTSLCPLRSGDFLAGFQIGSGKHAPDGSIRLCRSSDRGQTWQELPHRFKTARGDTPGSLAAAEMFEVAPGRILLFSGWFDRSDPTRPLFDPVTEGILRSRQLLSVSEDDGWTWSPWRELSTGELTGCAGTGPIVAWPDGSLAYPFESFKEFDDPRPARHAAWLLPSTDGGVSFGEPLLVARDPEHRRYYWDQRLAATDEPGKYVAAFWTHDREEQRDRRVHLLWGNLHDDSSDLPIETSVPGQIAAPCLWRGDELLLFVVDRDSPGTMTLWWSPDRGTTWPPARRLVVHEHLEQARLSQGRENIDFNAYWEDMGKWTFGHPAIRPLDSERVLLAYYAGTPDAMSVHWARVRVAPPLDSLEVTGASR